MRAFPPLAALLLVGCARPANLPEARAVTPQVSFQRADVQLISTEGVETVFRFAVHNPYRGVVEMESVTWTVELAGVQRRTGVTEGSDFDEAEAAIFDVPVRWSWADLEPVREAIGGEDSFHWTLEAVAVFDRPNDVARIPITAEGRLPIAPPPRATLVDLRPSGLGEGALLDVVLEVEGLPPEVPRIEYQLFVDHDRVGDGVVDASWVDGRLVVPVRVTDRGRAALDEGGELRLEGTVNVATEHGILPLRFEAGERADLDAPSRL